MRRRRTHVATYALYACWMLSAAAGRALGATAAPATHAPLPEAQSPQKFGRKGPPEAARATKRRTALDRKQRLHRAVNWEGHKASLIPLATP